MEKSNLIWINRKNNESDSVLCLAIRNKFLIKLQYRNQSRLVEPHLHGFLNDGREVFQAFQISGRSLSGQNSGWRLFIIGEASDIEIVEQAFQTRTDFKAQGSVGSIHCSVS